MMIAVTSRTSRVLVALLLSAMATSGCLITAPIAEHVPPANQAPRIVPEGVYPAESVVRVSLGRGVRTEFKLSLIADPDLRDTLYVRWFLNYYKGPQASEICSMPAGFPPPPEQTAQRKVEITCAVAHNDPRLRAGETAVLEVIVADRQPEPYDVKPYLKAFKKGALSDARSWVLLVEP